MILGDTSVQIPSVDAAKRALGIENGVRHVIQVRRALDMYRIEEGKYPDSLLELSKKGLIMEHVISELELDGVRYVAIGQDYELAVGGSLMAERGNDVFEMMIPDGAVTIPSLFGPQDAFRRYLERRIGVKINGARVLLSWGLLDGQVLAERALSTMLGRIRSGAALFLHDVDQLVTVLESDGSVDFKNSTVTVLRVPRRVRMCAPKPLTRRNILKLSRVMTLYL